MKNKLKKACRSSVCKVADSMPEDFVMPELSSECERNIAAIRPSGKKSGHPVFRVALVAAIIAAMSLGVFASTDSGKLVINRLYEFAQLSSSEEYNGEVTDDIVLGYVPEGFECTVRNHTDKFSGVYYVKHTKEVVEGTEYSVECDCFYVTKMTADITYCYDDSYYSEIETVERDGRQYYVVSRTSTAINMDMKSKEYNIIWNDGAFIYTIEFTEETGSDASKTLSLDDMLDVAKNLK